MPNEDGPQKINRPEDVAGKSGIYFDYYARVAAAYISCRTILGEPGFTIEYSEPEVRAKISKTIKKYVSYTEYIAAEKLPDRSTPKGKGIIIRLDDIAVEIKSFAGLRPKEINIPRLRALLAEIKSLVENQEE